MSKDAFPSEPSAHLVLQMAYRDISVLFRTPWIIITRGLSFVIQVFVFAPLIATLVHIAGFDFWKYYAIGAVVTTIASISFVIGYDIFEEAEEGLLDYLLTLPIPRRQFIIGRSLGGAISGIIYTLPLLIIIAVFWGFDQPLAILTTVASLFLLAFGVTGMAITMAVSVKTANRFDVVIALLELAVSRASIAAFPVQFLPPFVQPFAPFSPVSLAASNAHSLIGYSFDFLSIGGLVAFVVIFLGLGAAFYFRRLEGGIHA